ncbi:MAG: Flp pilus assembly complex ATPase component TadA [Phycisphaerales bacterium]|nr:Flp pilus assembly complex ATPase component TadA [Phycisphaerales bacterium]
MAIASLLLERGLITQRQLDQAATERANTGERIERALIRLGFVSRQQALDAVGDQFHMPVVDIASLAPDPAALAALPAKVVFRHRCVPIAKDQGTLTVATSDPYELAVLDELKLLTGCTITLVLADEDELQKFIRLHYGVGGDTLDAMAAGLDKAAQLVEAKPADEVEQAQEASVIKLVNDLLAEAIAERATDVHIEPYEHELIVRYRIDGVLHKANVPPTITRFGAAIISRLKIMASLNIAEKRRPQDGRITFRHRGPGQATQEFDLRVSVIPMIAGEGVVLRVLSKAAVLMPLTDLGMPDNVLTPWTRLIARPHGILLVTGPTGSGKSTTLYASLNQIVSEEIKVITIEDPVEYHVAGVNQIQVSHKVGLDFASGLRSILRHDPDVVMIGEIRDKETAETAIQASLTGHLVFSTLHTNDAAGATTRLLDMGVEPFLVSSSLEGVMAQRLVRRICRECATPYHPEKSELPAGFEMPASGTLTHGTGCRACRNTGHRGRVGIYELLSLSEHVREMIMARVNAPRIAAAAHDEGNLSLIVEDGFAKVRAGVTTLHEVASAVTT